MKIIRSGIFSILFLGIFIVSVGVCFDIEVKNFISILAVYFSSIAIYLNWSNQKNKEKIEALNMLVNATNDFWRFKSLVKMIWLYKKQFEETSTPYPTPHQDVNDNINNEIKALQTLVLKKGIDVKTWGRILKIKGTLSSIIINLENDLDFLRQHCDSHESVSKTLIAMNRAKE